MSSVLLPGLICMAERLVTTDGVQLCLETFGDRADAALLLISGLAQSMDWWDVGLCERLTAAGRYVIRYDHRDTGRSESFPPGKPDYTGDDLATDALHVLDALDVARAHAVGISAGGGIAQYLAALHPHRLHSITLIATTAAGDRADPVSLPPPEPRVAATFDDPAPEPDWEDRAAVIDYLVEGERPYAGTLGFDEERVRRIVTAVVERTRDVQAAVTNHWVIEQSAARFRLTDIDVPTLVLHGTADPLFPFPHGEALAAKIPGATLVPLPGMGHEIPPPQLWDVVVPAIVRM
jgi:pimeloyl-ACP methyl ester carboxylesterase